MAPIDCARLGRRMTSTPLVSIICFCKDRAATIRRAVDSVLSQSYRHIELVVQDGASTDGTLDILRSYDDPRIRLVSEPDSGPAEAFWKVLHRCQGEIVATCLSDEELLPGAIEKGVELLTAHPELGAATCDGYFSDPAGKITGRFVAGEFDFVNFLFGRYCPFWPGSFFRRQALIDVGLGDRDWTIEALEFEVWCRLAAEHHVKYFPVLMSKYAVDAGQLSNSPPNFNEHMDHRVMVGERIFTATGFAGDDAVKRTALAYNQRYLFYSHARAYRIIDQMEAIYHRMMDLLKTPAGAQIQAPRESDATDALQPPPILPEYYRHVAHVYQARGQIRQALEMCARAHLPETDALACRLMLRLPAANNESVLELQRRWASTHVHPTSSLDMRYPYNDDRKIRIGYSCAFMDSDTIRFIMSAVIRRHDRERFTVVGYSSTDVAADIGGAFDVLRVTHGVSDEAFAELVRSDCIDIFVELTGFSPHHRFGAMALRCAPIQINYLNHSATSGVPNVDLLLADAVAIPPEHDRFFTETVWRLPDCFLCYNYDMVTVPPVAPRPSRRNGFVTFGCFGSGSKINDDLIAIWARILHGVPRSRIYLRNRELTPGDNRQFMINRFRRHGIEAERICLESGATRGEIVRAYRPGGHQPRHLAVLRREHDCGITVARGPGGHAQRRALLEPIWRVAAACRRMPGAHWRDRRPLCRDRRGARAGPGAPRSLPHESPLHGAAARIERRGALCEKAGRGVRRDDAACRGSPHSRFFRLKPEATVRGVVASAFRRKKASEPHGVMVCPLDVRRQQALVGRSRRLQRSRQIEGVTAPVPGQIALAPGLERLVDLPALLEQCASFPMGVGEVGPQADRGVIHLERDVDAVRRPLGLGDLIEDRRVHAGEPARGLEDRERDRRVPVEAQLAGHQQVFPGRRLRPGLGQAAWFCWRHGLRNSTLSTILFLSLDPARLHDAIRTARPGGGATTKRR